MTSIGLAFTLRHTKAFDCTQQLSLKHCCENKWSAEFSYIWFNVNFGESGELEEEQRFLVTSFDGVERDLAL